MAEPAGPVWVDGELVPADRPAVSPLDRGLLLGEGAFATLVAVDGVPIALGRHLAQLRRSAATVGLEVPWSDAELRAAVVSVVTGRAGGGAGRTRVRVTVTGGPAPFGPGHAAVRPTVLVGAGPLAPHPPTAVVRTAPWPVNERSPLVGAKVTSRADLTLALADAQARGAHDALLCNTAGHLVEATGANVFLVVGRRLLTPALRSGCLPGVTRQLVLELAGRLGLPAEEVDVAPDLLAGADEVLLTSATRGVHGVSKVDDRELPAPGPVTARLAAALADLLATTPEP